VLTFARHYTDDNTITVRCAKATAARSSTIVEELTSCPIGEPGNASRHLEIGKPNWIS
jgi:hypothetical protein